MNFPRKFRANGAHRANGREEERDAQRADPEPHPEQVVRLDGVAVDLLEQLPVRHYMDHLHPAVHGLDTQIPVEHADLSQAPHK